jgi:hypothetical protein
MTAARLKVPDRLDVVMHIGKVQVGTEITDAIPERFAVGASARFSQA